MSASSRAGIAGGACLLVLAGLSQVQAAPCDGVHRSLPAGRQAVLAHAVASQMRLPTVDVLQSFRTGGWEILYVDTHASDETFLFFAGNPASHSPVTAWSGGARRDEQVHIQRWVLAHAPGIPSKLTRCFAWHVTKDRDR